MYTLWDYLGGLYVQYINGQRNTMRGIYPYGYSPMAAPAPPYQGAPSVQTAAKTVPKNPAQTGPKPIQRKQKPGKKTKQIEHFLTAKDFTAEDLSQEDLDTIISRYGIDIKDIYDLGPGQRWMFSMAKVVTSTFFTQTLFKAVAKINPASFRKNADEVVDRHDNLRTAFAHTDIAKPYQVVMNHRQAELSFHDISSTAEDELDDVLKRMMAADRRRGFDLEKDLLLRITVYKTGEETCAILVSQPHINIDGVSSGILYKELFIDYAMKESGIDTGESPDVAFKNYIDWLTTLDKTKELEYWKEVLKDLPELCPVPGYKKSSLEYAQASSGLDFSTEMSKKIRGLQREFKTTLNNIIQAAWGVMLSSICDREDVTFGSITSGRSAEVENSGMIMGGMVNAVPVRFKKRAEMSFREAAAEMQKQFAQSLEKSHCSPGELQQELGREEPIFDHLLNFHNFAGADSFSQAPAMPGITLLGSESFDNLSTDLCVYFGNVKGKFSSGFTYNKRTFTQKKIKLLQKNFSQVMEQICENPDILIGDIHTDKLDVFTLAEKEAAEEKMEMISALKEIRIFKGMKDSALSSLADYAELESYMVDDGIIKEKRTLSKVSFLKSGFVELSRVSTEGWLSSVRILKPGDMLAVEGLLEDTKTYAAYTAVSNEVTVISVPTEVMQEFLEKYPEVSLHIMDSLNAQLKAMTSLWVNTV